MQEIREMQENREELDCSMGLYPFTRRNQEKLFGCEFVELTEYKPMKARVFVFQDKYRKLKIDLFFLENGEMLIGDYYGETMKREEMFYVVLKGRNA